MAQYVRSMAAFFLAASAAWVTIGFAFEGPQSFGAFSTVVHLLLAITAMVLAPAVALGSRRSYLLALTTGVVTIAYLLVTLPQRWGGDIGQVVAPVVWALLQAPVLYFVYQAQKTEAATNT